MNVGVHMNQRKRAKDRLFALGFALVMVLSVGFSPGASQVQPALGASIHPALIQLAAQAPSEMVRVIVRLSDGADPETAAAELDGELVRDLSIINSIVLRLPAGEVPNLRQKPVVEWVSLDAPVVSTSTQAAGLAQTHFNASAFPQTTGADHLWAQGIDGRGVTVAVVDSGITDYDDFKDAGGNLRILDWVQFSNSQAYHPDDYHGHGSHVAGTIGGNGALSQGRFMGMAPGVNLLTVKISDDYGMSHMSDVVAGLQWVLAKKEQYNIRVVNLSLNSTVPESYHTSPLNAALEILWFNGVVVVVSAGNNGNGRQYVYAPGNDPFVITVGASNDKGTENRSDDQLMGYTARGTTPEGFAKPDIIAPGHNVVSLMGKPDSVLANTYPDRRIVPPGQSNYFYFRMSGTSMASAVVAGAAALLIQDEPNLTPDQVKYRLMNTGSTISIGQSAYPYLDVYAAVHGNTTQSANVGTQASQLLWGGAQPVTWSSVNWNSVNWNSVNWNSVNWNSVNWNSVNWNSEYWGE